MLGTTEALCHAVDQDGDATVRCVGGANSGATTREACEGAGTCSGSGSNDGTTVLKAVYEDDGGTFTPNAGIWGGDCTFTALSCPAITVCAAAQAGPGNSHHPHHPHHLLKISHHLIFTFFTPSFFSTDKISTDKMVCFLQRLNSNGYLLESLMPTNDKAT